MPIKRSQYQSPESLEDFYTSNEWKHPLSLCCEQMLILIERINSMFVKTELTAYTSHTRLCIQDLDNDQLNPIVIVSYCITGEYYIEYKAPNHKSPWNNAWVRGTTNSLSEIIQLLLIAMHETKNWKNCTELTTLLEATK